jgi:hypothetical protein
MRIAKCPYKVDVVGSIPTAPTNYTNYLRLCTHSLTVPTALCGRLTASLVRAAPKVICVVGGHCEVGIEGRRRPAGSRKATARRE